MTTPDLGWTLAGGLFQHPRPGVAFGLTSRGLGDMKDASRRTEAAKALGLGEPITTKQVHGTLIHVICPPEFGHTPVGGMPTWGGAQDRGGHPAVAEGDGLITTDPAVSVAVLVADCVPLFLWDESGEAVGVFHAGWRGLEAGMPRAAIRAFERLGRRPDGLFAAAGPHICPRCYRVGEEFRSRFRRGSLSERGGGLFLDLGGEARSQLLEAGVPESRISVSADCTSCRPEDLFSFRRDGSRRSMMAVIGRKG